MHGGDAARRLPPADRRRRARPHGGLLGRAHARAASPRRRARTAPRPATCSPTRTCPRRWSTAFARRAGGHLGDRLVAALAAGPRRRRRGGAGALGRAGRRRRVAWPVDRPARRLDRRRPDRGARARSGSGWQPLADDYVTRALDPAPRRATGCPAMSDRHPLDPLDGRRGRARRRARARRRPGLSDRVRVVVGRAARAGQGRLPGLEGGRRRRRRARRSACCSTTAAAAASRSSSRSTTMRLVSAPTCPRACSRRSTATSSWRWSTWSAPTRATSRPLRARGVDPADVHVEPWSSGDVRARSGAARARDLVGAPRRRRRQPLLAPAVRPGRRRRPQRDARRCASTTTRPATPPPSGDGGDYRDGGGRPYRDDLRPIEITQPRGAELHARRPPSGLAEVGPARSASIPARASCCTTSATRTRGERRSICHRASIAELVIPYGDPNPTDALQERVRHRRVRPRRRSRTRSSSAATASARSPTWTASRTAWTGEPLHDPERDLHPRGGRRTCSGSTPTTTPAASTGRARGGS